MKTTLIALFFLFSLQVSSQVINAESFRKKTDTSGFSGSVSLDFSLKRDVNEKFSIATNIGVQYKKNKHLILLKNEIEFQKIERSNFENKGIQHLRYNYKLFPHIIFEAFAQAQYNKVSKIDFRGLLGLGPRFKLSDLENYKFYLGILIMYEQEEISDGATPIERVLRGSAYFSFSLFPTETISIISTTYFQPKLQDITDYRVATETSMVINLYKKLSFKTTYTFTYEETPAVGIPNSQYNLSSGILYVFD